MDWFWYAFLSAVMFTIYSILVRIHLKKGSDAKVFTVLSNVATGIVLLCLIPFVPFEISLEIVHLPLVILASLLFAFSSMLFTIGRQTEEVSTVSVIRLTSVFWIFLGGFFLFSEQMSVYKIFGTLLLFAGTTLVLLKNGRFMPSKGMWRIFLATISLSVNSLITKELVEHHVSPPLYGSAMFVLSAFWVFIFLNTKKERIINEIKLQKGNVIIVSVFLALSIFFLFMGYRAGDISKVFPVYSSYVVMAVIAGMVFLHEKDHAVRKIAGSVLAFIGVVILRLF